HARKTGRAHAQRRRQRNDRRLKRAFVIVGGCNRTQFPQHCCTAESLAISRSRRAAYARHILGGEDRTMIARTSWMTFLAGAFVAGVLLGGCERTATPTATAPAAATPASAESLAGTSWQLVKVTGSDGKSVEPDDRSKYTLSFEPGGAVVARIDC